MKKPISFILILCMVLAMMPMMSITASAAAGDTFMANITVGGSDVPCTFRVIAEPDGATPGAVQIGTGTGSAIPTTAAGMIAIPSTIADTDTETSYTVTKIGDKAFNRCYELTGTLTIPDSVTSIGASAFYLCYNLTGTLTIPDSVTEMGDNAFNYCSKLTGLELTGSALTRIENSTFANCDELTGLLTIPDSVTTIGQQAFYNCRKLSGLELTGGALETIGSFAFYNCGQLTGTLTIPASVTTIGASAFEIYNFMGYRGISELEFAADSQLLSIGNKAFSNNNEITGTLTIPASVRTIGEYAFSDCTSFSELQLTASALTSIGRGAFSGCNFTGSLIIPDTITTIEPYTFQYCDFTGPLNIPARVTTIGDYAFNGCASFSALQFASGSNLTFIGPKAFQNCSGLTGSLTIPASVTSIGNAAFYNCSRLTGDLTIPASVIRIENGAFYNCTSLSALRFASGSNLTYLGQGAFQNCSGLTGNLIIPEGVKEIYGSAFRNCSGLDGTLTLPASLTYMGEYAFTSCGGLTGPLTIPASITHINNNTFEGCSGFTSLRFASGSNLSGIMGNAFNGCSGLTGTLTIPASIYTMYNFAFEGCGGLTALELQGNSLPTSMGTNVFKDCGNLANLIVPASWTGSNSVTLRGIATPFAIGTGNMVKDAGLTSVLGQTVTAPAGGSGNTTGTAITWSIDAADAETQVSLGNVVSAPNSTAKLYSNPDFNANEDQAITLSAGETSAYIKVTANDTGTIRYHKVRINKTAAPTYTIQTIGNQTMTALTESYGTGTQETKTVTITRTGTGNLTSLTTAISGTNADSFAITQPITTTLSSGIPSTTFTIKANDGLAEGTYTAMITISATGMSDQTFTVTQVVSPAGTKIYTISADTEQFHFGSLTAGYGSAPAAQTVTIANTGNQTITLTEPGATNTSSNYIIGLLSDTTLDASETATFTVQPRKGLAVGTYNETININGFNGSNNATASITAQFSVTSAGTDGSGGSGGGGGGTKTPAIVTKIESGGSVALTNLEGLVKEGKKLTVEGKAGEKLVFDTEALKNINGQTKDSVKVEIKDVSAEHKNEQPGRLVVSLTITAGGKHITSFGKGSATVSLPYELKAGEKAQDVTVWYLAEDGTMSEVPCTYDAATKLATFKVNHFSLYIVGTADTSKWTNPFLDVKEGSWFYDAVRYVSANGLMQGTSDTAFNPGAKTTRGMILTILWRMENQPKAGMELTFSDVKKGKYYYEAVAWASEKGIAGGYSADRFAPEDNITREQLAVILLNYAASKGYKTDTAADLSGYSDSGMIHSWSKAAMSWANAEGMISGVGNNRIDPAGAAQRSQVAVILQRFVEDIAK